MAYNQPQVQATLGKLDDQTLLGMLNRPGGVLPPSTPMDIQQQLAKNAQTRQSQVATAGAPAQMPAVPTATPPNTPAGISGLQAPNMTAMAEGGIVPGMEGGEDPNALLLQQLQAELAKRTGSGAPGIAGMAKGGKVQHFDKGGSPKDRQYSIGMGLRALFPTAHFLRPTVAEDPTGLPTSPEGTPDDPYTAAMKQADFGIGDVTDYFSKGLGGILTPPPAQSVSPLPKPQVTTAQVPAAKLAPPSVAGSSKTHFYGPPETAAAFSKAAGRMDTDLDTTGAALGTGSTGGPNLQAAAPGAGQDPTDALRRNYKLLRELAGVDKDDEDYKALLAAQRTKVDARNPLELAGLAAISRIGNVQPGRSGWASLGAGLSGLAEGWGQGIASKQQAQDALTNAELARVGARGKMNEGIAKVATDMLGYRSPEQRQLDELAKIDATGKWHERVAGIHESGRAARAAAGTNEGPDPLKVAQYVQRAEDSFAKLNQNLKLLSPQQYEAGLENARQKAIEEFYTLSGQPLPKAYADRKAADTRKAAVMGGVSGVQAAPAK